MNNKKEALKKIITIHWWNMGKRTLNHSGTYKEFFDKKDIKISKIKHPITKENNGLRFRMSLGCSIITFDTFGGSLSAWDYSDKFDDAIKLFLAYLGDKTEFDGTRTYKINWR